MARNERSPEPQDPRRRRLVRRVRLLLGFFVVALVLSGLTAFPVVAEIRLLDGLVGQETTVGASWPALGQWISHVRQGLEQMDRDYPFMAYGTDWLAFAHLVIAVAFWGPIRDPVKNAWVVDFGLIACVMVFPLALICGPIRGVPWIWQLIDCSFGFFGLFPLWLVRRDIGRLAKLE